MCFLGPAGPSAYKNLQLTLIILCRGARVLKNELKANTFWMSSSFIDFKSAVKLLFFGTQVFTALKNLQLTLIHLCRGARVLENEMERAESKYSLDVVFFQ